MPPSGTASHHALDARLDALFASDPAALADPFTLFHDVRHAAPVYRHAASVILTRYADIRSVLTADGSLYSNRAFIEGSRAEALMAAMPDEDRRLHREVSAFESNYISRSDGAQHKRLRQIAHRAFTPRRIAALEPAIRGYADALLDELSDEPVIDFMTFAYRLPLLVVGELLGVPDDDRETIRAWSAAIARNRTGADPVALRAAKAALTDFRAYVQDVIARSSGSDGSDLVAALMDARDGDRMTHEELTAMFVLLLFAGHETTTNLLAIGLTEMLRRGEWQTLVDHPDVVDTAVEELLRYASPVQWLGRIAVQDVEIDGCRIDAGTTVVPILAAANRDPEMFADPDRLDLRRPNASAHIALAFGPHYCLGASLTRLEGRIAFTALATRFPELELAIDPSEIPWTGHALIRTIAELPVRLGPEHRSADKPARSQTARL